MLPFLDFIVVVFPTAMVGNIVLPKYSGWFTVTFYYVLHLVEQGEYIYSIFMRKKLFFGRALACLKRENIVVTKC